MAACTDEAALRAWHTKYFGRQGEVQQAVGRLKDVPPPERPEYGKEVNRIKESLTAAYEEALIREKSQALERSLTTDALDVTLPGRPVPRGRLHLSTQALREVCAIFADMGFQVYRSREVEDDLTNFELLNMPPHHPARDMWDTFHTTTPGVILRTHTSPGQIHVMRELCPEPIRVILPGMCYRYEAITTRSEIQFHQVEGLVVGEHVTMADLKGTITAFARRMFGTQRHGTDSFELLPVHRAVDRGGHGLHRLRRRKAAACASAPAGSRSWAPAWCIQWCCATAATIRHASADFAFGMGPERIAMRKYGIDDIRQFWADDLRFLGQF